MTISLHRSLRTTALAVASSAALATACLGATHGAAPASSNIRSAFVAGEDLRAQPSAWTQQLVVADNNLSQLEVLGTGPAFNWLSNVTAGAPCPSGAWIQRTLPLLYVSNFGCRGPVGVTSYKRVAGVWTPVAPIGGYTAGLVDPINSTTDSANHVFVADNIGNQLVEFNPGVGNAYLYRCTIPGPATGVGGVAVDAAGDVFATIEQNPVKIIEYPGPAGLSNCAGAVLTGATLPSPAGSGALLLDNGGRLIACDQNAIYTIPPPYTTPVLFETDNCLNMSLNHAGNTLFVTEPFVNNDIRVLRYPNHLVRTIITPSASNHISSATGVAAYPG